MAKARRFSIVSFLTRWIAGALLVWLLATVGLVVALRYVAPPATAMMLEQPEPLRDIHYEWRARGAIAATVARAVIASEDQRFIEHHGIDFKSLNTAIDDYRSGDDLRGASTITQQVAKNLFLWPGRSFARKAVEAYFALLHRDVLVEAAHPRGVSQHRGARTGRVRRRGRCAAVLRYQRRRAQRTTGGDARRRVCRTRANCMRTGRAPTCGIVKPGCSPRWRCSKPAATIAGSTGDRGGARRRAQHRLPADRRADCANSRSRKLARTKIARNEAILRSASERFLADHGLAVRRRARTSVRGPDRTARRVPDRGLGRACRRRAQRQPGFRDHRSEHRDQRFRRVLRASRRRRFDLLQRSKSGRALSPQRAACARAAFCGARAACCCRRRAPRTLR